MGQGTSVSIKSSQGKYISANHNGRVRGDQFERNEDALFEIHFIDSLTVAFRSYHGKWLCVEPSGYIVCDREYRGSWEAFTLVPTSFGKFAFKTTHGKFLSVLNDGYFSAIQTFVGDWEMFDIELDELEEGPVTILGSHGHYLTADPEGKVFATRDKSGKSEIFERCVLGPTQVAFKSNYGKWLTADLEGHVSVQEKRGKGGVFYIHPAPSNKYLLRSCFSKFLSAEPDGKVVATRDVPLDWEAFAIKSV